MATKKKAKKTAKKAKATPAKKAAARRVAAAARKPARAARPKAPKKAAKKPAARAKAKPSARAKAKPSARAKAKPSARAATRGASAARAKPIKRRDRAGHMDPHYAADLRKKSGERGGEPEGFIARARSKDDLVEELGEEFVTEATSAEHEGEDMQDQEVPEERGGPFVQTTGDQEFAHGTDPSNPKGASREPFPRT
jgi:hypothetical protein